MIGIAVMGTGVIAESHIRAYLEFSNRCNILALCDLVPGKAEALKRKFRLEDAVVYDDYGELLKRGDITMVSICTPPFAHAECAISCMRKGKHVLVEKPMAASLEECDEMIRVQKKTGKYMGVVCQNRYNQENHNLKELISSGEAGRVLLGQVESCWFRGREYYEVWWRGTWEGEGGGCTLNHAVHQIDLLNWIMGPPQTVTAVLKNVAHDNAETEDVSAAILTYESGALVTLTASLVTHGEGQSLRFQCEHAGISAPWQVSCSRSDTAGFPEKDREAEAGWKLRYDAKPKLSYTGHGGQIDHMLECLERNKCPSGDGNDGRMALEVITAIYQSGAERRTVQLPLGKDSPFYTKKGMLSHAEHFYHYNT